MARGRMKKFKTVKNMNLRSEEKKQFLQEFKKLDEEDKQYVVGKSSLIRTLQVPNLRR